jgi:molybdopterin converting factor subunit 1
MRVKVRLFARLRDAAGAGELEREVPEGATAADVWRTLADEFPAIDAYRSSISVAVNEKYSRMTTTVGEGDEIAFLPPVSGG